MVVGLADLQGHPSVAQLDFNLTAVGLPTHEKTRTLTNLIFVLVSTLGSSSVRATVIAATPAKTIDVALTNGVVYSNRPPITGPLSTVPHSLLVSKLRGTFLQSYLALSMHASNKPSDPVIPDTTSAKISNVRGLSFLSVLWTI